MTHYANGGLQTHSIGDIYPWSIVVLKTPGKPDVQIQLTNRVTGEVKRSFLFGNALDDFAGFHEAHAAAERFVPTYGPDVPYKRIAS
jgi:hypothetical protein